MPMELGQWNNPAWREKHPARPSTGTGFAVEATTPQCDRCGSSNLRPAGWFTSKTWNEQHQDVQCRDCKKYCRLPVGVELPKAVKETIEPEPVLANDPRPACPHCGSQQVHRRDRQPTGRRRWHCVPCNRRFVANDVATFVDHRRVEHFDRDNPLEEARALHQLAQTQGIEEIRETIQVSVEDTRILDVLMKFGCLDPRHVEQALAFRAQVLDQFDRLAGPRLPGRA